MAKETVYLETTVISYLAARASGDLVVAACQKMTRMWWETRRDDFDLFVSERVVAESSAGDPDAVKKRLDLIRELPVLEVTVEATSLAGVLVSELHLPSKAAEDALHIAIATASGMDYLLSWNCRHIANARVISRVQDVATREGYKSPVICTPQELLEDYR